MTYDLWAETANGTSPLLDRDHGEKGNQKLVDEFAITIIPLAVVELQNFTLTSNYCVL